jgi:hypothetical protein
MGDSSDFASWVTLEVIFMEAPTKRLGLLQFTEELREQEELVLILVLQSIKLFAREPLQDMRG